MTLTDSRGLSRILGAAIGGVCPASDEWRLRGARRLERLTKPPGSLGWLEAIALRCCAIQETLDLETSGRRVVVCAADHGVTVEGVSAYPAEVTAQMVTNFLRGGAAINALAATVHAEVRVVDVGVAGIVAEEGGHAQFVSRRIRNGSRNMVEEPAMTEAELLAALQVGLDEAERAAAEGIRLVGLGEMGIGNTTAASAVTAALTGRPVAEVTGRGSGIDETTLARKVRIVERALTRHQVRSSSPLEILRCVGGLEIAALCGLCLGAAGHRLVIITDGFIATSAAMLAAALCPGVSDYLFAAHLSPEPGHVVQLEWLGVRPLLALDMRLGEGTGAALAMPVIDAAARAFTSMATFESAGVSDRA